MDEIAAATIVTKLSLYYHFESEDHLLAAVLDAQHELALAAFKTFGDRLSGSPEAIIVGLFDQLAVWADKPRWAGSGFTRLVIELADLPGHPARAIARRHKALLEAHLAELLAPCAAAPRSARHHRRPRGRACAKRRHPFITPDPPWLSDVPVVFAIMMLLIIIGLVHRIQSEPGDADDARRTRVGPSENHRFPLTRSQHGSGLSAPSWGGKADSALTEMLPSTNSVATPAAKQSASQTATEEVSAITKVDNATGRKPNGAEGRWVKTRKCAQINLFQPCRFFLSP